MMDLSEARFSTDKANSEGVRCILRDPATDDDLYDGDEPVAIWVVGRDSKEYKRYQSETESKYRGKKAPYGGKARALALELLARCTKKFDNLSIKGEPVEMDTDSIVEFYKAVPWAKEQVDEFIHDRANFLGNSQKT